MQDERVVDGVGAEPTDGPLRAHGLLERHHFRDKGALLAAVAVEGYRVLHAEVGRALEKAGADPRARLRALAEAYVAFGVRHPSHYRVMFRPALADPDAEPGLYATAGGSFDVLVQLVREARGSAQADRDVTAEAITVWATLHGLVSLWNEGPLRRKVRSASILPLARGIARQMVHRLAAPAAAPPSARAGGPPRGARRM